MSRRNERFNRSMRSLEAMIAGMADSSKSAKLSDRGKSAARMYAAFESEPDTLDRNQELAGAVLRLIVEGMDHLVPTLLLIAENGSGRTESIAEMSKQHRGRNAWHASEVRYFRHRDALLKIFDVSLVCTEI